VEHTLKRLLLMRHARSGNKRPGMSDHDRPLDESGERDAKRIGRLIRSEGAAPDLIMSSTAERARRTAELISEACSGGQPPWLVPDLYLAGQAEWLRQLGALPDEYHTVMLVGHNPGLEGLLEALTGSEEMLSTAALADLQLAIDDWSELPRAPSGRLQRLWRPEELEQ
jgi:phosphohistidine phosphatase